MDEDLKLKLLASLPLEICDGIFLYPLTLKEIATIGYSKYNSYLYSLIPEPKDILKDAPKDVCIEDIEGLHTFDIVAYNCVKGTQEYRNIICDAMKLFLREEVSFGYDKNDFWFLIGDEQKIIDNESYEIFKNYLTQQNCIKSHDDESLKIDKTNKRAKELYEYMQKEKEKLNKVKTMSDDQLTLSDLISILASNSNLTITEIFNLSLYIFNDQFNRMKILDDYKVNIQSLLAGADAQKINLKYFISKIDNNKP